jgi:DUF2950 family protein
VIAGTMPPLSPS